MFLQHCNLLSLRIRQIAISKTPCYTKLGHNHISQHTTRKVGIIGCFQFGPCLFSFDSCLDDFSLKKKRMEKKKLTTLQHAHAPENILHHLTTQ